VPDAWAGEREQGDGLLLRSQTGAPTTYCGTTWTILVHVIVCARRQRALQRLVFASTSEVYADAFKYFIGVITLRSRKRLTGFNYL
jgi:hypothetical protein